MRMLFLPCLVAVVMALVPAGAAAQHVAYATVPQGYSTGHTPPTGPTSLVRVPIEGDRLGALTTLATMPGVGGNVVVSAGGRFVLWRASDAGGCRLGIFDTALGINTQMSCPETGPLVDPVRERVIVSSGGELAVFSADGIAPIPNTQGASPRAMSTDGLRVFASRIINNAFELHAIDVATGSVAWSIPLGSSHFKAVNEDESLVFVTANNSTLLRALDASTGAVVHEMVMPAPGDPSLQAGDLQAVVDTDGQRLVMSLSYSLPFFPSTGAYWTVDLGTWTEVSSVSVPGPPRLVQGPARSDIFGTAQQEPRIPYWHTCSASDFVRVDAATGETISLGQIPGGPCISWDVAFAPAAAELPAPSVAGSSVMLAWTQPPGVTTGTVVEAGSAPGLADLATLPVAAGQTTLTVTDVPTGTYYVRLRTQNHAGPSAPSNEVIVVVP